MAKDNSFDIVSEVNMQELDNAFQQVKREIKNRYDLKDSGSSVDFDKKDNKIIIVTSSDFVCNQIKDIVLSKCIKRNIDISALNWSKINPCAGANVTQSAQIVCGIDKNMASTINKDIKSQKFKCKTQIEGEKIRVSSSSRDVLQDVIKFLKDKDYDIPLQFTNYR